MKKLNVTKERFEKSNYFKRKYGKLKYVSESGKLFKTDKGKVLMFNEAIMGGGGYEPSYDDDEEPLAEWKVGEIVDIDAWQVMWEYDDDEPLPEKGWKIVNVERDEYYDDCDGYCYTIVNTRNPKLKVEVSASALVERKQVKKSGRNLKKSTKKFKESTDIKDEVWSKWERMSDEITSALNLEQVAKSVAKKYFPRKANEIANWINENIELICTIGYAEDWTDLNGCLWEFTEDNDIPISDLA